MLLNNKSKPPFRALRFVFVLASFSPLFFLYAVKGSPVISDLMLWIGALAIISTSNGLLYYRWHLVEKEDITTRIEITKASDNREHLFAYLLAVLLSLYGVSPASEREIFAYLLTILLVITLFWMANLHYLNVIFTLLGYKTYTVTYIVNDGKSIRSEHSVLLSKQQDLPCPKTIICYRLSHDVFVEK